MLVVVLHKIILTVISKGIAEPFPQDQVQKAQFAAFAVRVFDQLVFVYLL